MNMENQFSNIFFTLCFGILIFFSILEYCYFANFALKHCGKDLLCWNVTRVCDIVYEKEIVAWSKLNSA